MERLLDRYLVTGGRLILCSYGSSRRGAEPVGETLRGWGYAGTGEFEGKDTSGAVITPVAWIDAPHPLTP